MKVELKGDIREESRGQRTGLQGRQLAAVELSQ
jgi:hypothetical protein